MTVTGVNFTANTSIMVGGQSAARVNFLNSTTLQVQLPANSAGWADMQAVDLGNGLTSAVATNAYLFMPPPEGKNEVSNHAAAPNPITDPSLASIQVELAGSADGMRIRIYTKSMVVVTDWTDMTALRGSGWHSVPFPPGFLAECSNGFYYYVLEPVRNGEVGERVIGKFMVLK